MTLSDSETMKLPAPIVKDMSCILVSKKRLISVLGHMGFLADTDGQSLLSMTHALWQECYEYTKNTNTDLDDLKLKVQDINDTASSQNDDEESDMSRDLVQLGTLKWILYGFPASQPKSWSSFCMPCGTTAADKALDQRQDKQAQEEHPVQVSSMKRRHGELVRHDVMTCKVCRGATGCSDCSSEHDNDEQGLQMAHPAFTEEEVPSDEEEDDSHNNDTSPYKDLMDEAGDDVSGVYASDDSAVEVSALPATLLAVEHRLEEKMRV